MSRKSAKTQMGRESLRAGTRRKLMNWAGIQSAQFALIVGKRSCSNLLPTSFGLPSMTVTVVSTVVTNSGANRNWSSARRVTTAAGAVPGKYRIRAPYLQRHENISRAQSGGLIIGERGERRDKSSAPVMQGRRHEHQAQEGKLGEASPVHILLREAELAGQVAHSRDDRCSNERKTATTRSSTLHRH